MRTYLFQLPTGSYIGDAELPPQPTGWVAVHRWAFNDTGSHRQDRLAVAARQRSKELPTTMVLTDHILFCTPINLDVDEDSVGNRID